MAMTAHANKKERDKCIGLGMDDYISKPFDPFDLKQKIVALSRKTIGGTCELLLQEETSASDSTTKLTNLDYLRELSENNESFFRDFITLFLNNTPESLADLDAQLLKQNWEGVRQAAHKVKPSLNYLGLKDAQKLAASIEQFAISKSNLNLIPDLVTELNNICKAAFAELETELKSTSINT